MAITDLPSFKTYCLSMLGEGVTKVNVSIEQLDNAVEDAIALFNERHYDGNFKTYIKYTVTAADIIANTTDVVMETTNNFRPSSIQLPSSVMRVNNLISLKSANVFSTEWRLELNAIQDLNMSDGSLNTYLMQQDRLEQLRGIFQKGSLLRFRKEDNTLSIDVDWGNEIKEDDVIVIDATIKTDVVNSSNLLNDVWLKKYATSLIKKIWAQNLIKFEGVSLVGGVKINGRAIYEDATNEILTLEEELNSTYSDPLTFFMA